MNRLLLAAASLTVLAACASTADAPVTTADASPPVASADVATEFERAMITVESLEEAGNTPTAIDRLTQLLGDPTLTDNEKADVLFRRGTLRVSDTGFDTWGAIEDFEEILAQYPSDRKSVV